MDDKKYIEEFERLMNLANMEPDFEKRKAALKEATNLQKIYMQSRIHNNGAPSNLELEKMLAETDTIDISSVQSYNDMVNGKKK